MEAAMRAAWVLLTLSLALSAAPRRVLYVTHSAGFRHDSIPLSQQVLPRLDPNVEVVATEDLAAISADSLAAYDAVYFFTSGELALSAAQKSALLDFVRQGKGFGAVHSATDTLYSWPEYGDLIGGYFDEHPWAQEVSIDIEDPDHPLVSHLAPGFRIAEEIYQFRDFSRERVRVLMTLDASSVNLSAPGVHRTDGDFALAWCRNYGKGRVFYTALGHLEETWRDQRFQTMVRQSLLWLTGQLDADAAPRAAAPVIAQGGVVDALTYSSTLRAGGYLSIFGAGLTSGSTAAASATTLAGTSVTLAGVRLRLLYASPGQINAVIPAGSAGTAELRVTAAGAAAAATITIQP